MLQQIIALIIIAFILARLFWQKQKEKISASEFIFWLVFWCVSALAIIFLKWIDLVVSDLGFSSTGINFLIYLGMVLLFYLIFKINLKLEKMDREITKIVREEALKNRNKIH